MFMKMSKKPKKLTDVDIYKQLLSLIAEVEGVNEIRILETTTIQEALNRLRVGVKYRMLDLEATVRDCRRLMKLLEDDGKTQK